MASTSSSQISLITLTILLLFTTTISSSATQPRPFNKIYAFGDSYTDTGNTRFNTLPKVFRFVSNPPYGRTFFHHATNRYSDGRLVIDFVTQALSLPFLPPHLDPKADKSHGVNFAVAGSTAIVHSFFVKNNLTLNITPESLETQLTWFNEILGSKGCKNMVSTAKECEVVFGDALIWVGEIGANDYGYSFRTSVTTQTIQQLAINSVTAFLQALLPKGAKYVVVQGLPPRGCLSLTMSMYTSNDRDAMGCVGSLNNQTTSHNTALLAKINMFRQKFPKSTIVYADYYSAYSEVMKSGSKYGFKELYKTCCGNGGGMYNFNYFDTCGSPNSTTSCAHPSQYVNWDGVHSTEGMYKVMAHAFVNGTYCQPSFSYLLSKKKQELSG